MIYQIFPDHHQNFLTFHVCWYPAIITVMGCMWDADLHTLKNNNDLQPSRTFNAETNLLKASVSQHLLGYIAVLYVLEESAHSCTVDHCQMNHTSHGFCCLTVPWKLMTISRLTFRCHLISSDQNWTVDRVQFRGNNIRSVSAKCQHRDRTN